MPLDSSEHKRALAHVCWIGGPPDAGKSTVADLLGGQHGLPVYHFDRYETAHIARADPARHPELRQLGTKLAGIGEPAWLEEEWVRATPEEMVRRTIARWSERVGLAVEDLLALPADRPIIAEGPGFFPGAIVPLLASPRQAVVLVPCEAFKRASHERRGKSTGRGERTSDPGRYRRNHIARDLLMAEHYRRTAQESGLLLIEVDGSRSAEEVAAVVGAHFGSRLAAVAPTHPTA
jgi:2-phosphoglycerate kinase